MRTEIRRIVKEFGLTAVYVTHDQKEALSIADRMAIMESGRIAQVGTPVDIYQNPYSKSVADFIGESNYIEGIIEGLAGVVDCTTRTVERFVDGVSGVIEGLIDGVIYRLGPFSEGFAGVSGCIGDAGAELFEPFGDLGPSRDLYRPAVGFVADGDLGGQVDSIAEGCIDVSLTGRRCC